MSLAGPAICNLSKQSAAPALLLGTVSLCQTMGNVMMAVLAKFGARLVKGAVPDAQVRHVAVQRPLRREAAAVALLVLAQRQRACRSRARPSRTAGPGVTP